MTTPHIETIARAMCIAEDFDPDGKTSIYKTNPKDADIVPMWMEWESQATLAFNMSVEICAEVGDDLAKVARSEEAKCRTEEESTQDEWWAVQKERWGFAASFCEKASRRIRALVPNVPKEG